MRKVVIIVIFLIIVFAPDYIFAQETPNLKIHFIDVGEGEAIFIETPNRDNFLLDTGNFVSGYRVVEYLKKLNIQNLNHLILTHAHLDHIGGVFFVLQMLDVKRVYDNGEDFSASGYPDIYRWYEELVRKNKNYKRLKANDILYADNVVLKVLWPPEPFQFSDANANSLVIMLEYGKFRCLLGADLTVPAEKKLLEQEVDLKADVLKVNHHGAGDANSEEFLAAVSPKIAVISIDKANIRGYPAEEVISRLRKLGIQLYRTDIDGDIILTIYPSTDKEFEIKINKIKG